MTTLARVLGGLFPDGVGAAVVPIGTAPPSWPQEVEAMRHAVPHRRAEFAAGRAAARAAMAAAGLPEAAIPMAEDRAPVWPIGTVGSITHSVDHALAVAASAKCAAALGIDAEPDRPLPDDVLSDICDGDECSWIAGQAEPLRWARLIFVAKEAAYKCQYPASRALFGFETITIRVDPAAGSLLARFSTEVPPYAAGHEIGGRFARSRGLIIAGFIEGAG